MGSKEGQAVQASGIETNSYKTLAHLWQLPNKD